MRKISFVVLASALALCAQFLFLMSAQGLEADSDGRVPVLHVCDRGYTMFAAKFPETRGKPWVGRTWTYPVNNKTEARIYINTCVMRDHGLLTPEYYRYVLQHEYLHAAGYSTDEVG